jgi:hypothetical protein
MSSESADFTTLTYFSPEAQFLIKGIDCLVEGQGTVNLKVQVYDGNVHDFVLNVLYVPKLKVKLGVHGPLFSQSQAKAKGHNFIYRQSGNYIELVKLNARIPIYDYQNLYFLHSRILKSTRTALVAPQPEAWELWHDRLGHLSPSGMDNLLKSSTQGVNFRACPNHICKICALTKSTAAPMNRDLSVLPTQPDYQLGVDLFGPLPLSIVGQKRYALGFIDYATGLITMYFLKTKDEVPKYLEAHLKPLSGKVKRIRFDNDTVFTSGKSRDLCRTFGIPNSGVEFSAPYSQFQNGRIERVWRTIETMARGMLKRAQLPISYWSAAMAHATYIKNRIWSSRVNGIPYELYTGKAADLSELKIFGCPAYAHIPSDIRKKFADRAYEGIYIGSSSETPGYLVYKPKTHQILKTRSVDFDEHWLDPPSHNPSTPVPSSNLDLPPSLVLTYIVCIRVWLEVCYTPQGELVLMFHLQLTGWHDLCQHLPQRTLMLQNEFSGIYLKLSH